MLKIGTFSKLSRLSIRMLRRYDELGLLQPVHTDPFTGYRYYREEQLTTAGRIAALRDMGFGLSAIGALLEDGGREELDRRLAEQQRVLEALLAETRQRLRLLETARAQLRKDESTMEYSVTLKNLPQRRAACVRMTLPSYEAEHQLWQVMARETAPLSLRLEEPCPLLRHLLRRGVPGAGGGCGGAEDGPGRLPRHGARPLPHPARRDVCLGHLPGALRQDPRGQRRRGRLGAGQRLCL